MMGGIGSGRRGGPGRNTTENCRSLDSNKLQRTGCFEPGWAGGWQWTREGEQVTSITLRAEADRLDLSYRFRVAGGDWQDVHEREEDRERRRREQKRAAATSISKERHQDLPLPRAR